MLQLVKQAMTGDEEAFIEVIEQQSLAMYKVSRSMLQNDEDAADAIQETILICFENLHTLRQPKYFKTWMTRILINECNRILRERKRQTPQEELPETSAEDKSYAEIEFLQLLDSIEEKYRIVLTLYYVQDFKISEIAELLNINENTVKTRLARARVQIKELYSDRQGGKRHGKADKSSDRAGR